MNFLKLVSLIMMLSVPPLSFADKAKEDIWVFGDSLTSPPYSWAEVIDDFGFAQMRNTARGGLRMVDVIMPDWLVCAANNNRKYDKVIIWLGGNDALQQISVLWFERKLRDHLQFLEGRECDVWIALPPTFEGSQFEGLTDPYRDVIEKVAMDYDNVTVLDPPHPVEHTGDGIHQNQGLMFWQAVYFVNKMDITPPEKDVHGR